MIRFLLKILTYIILILIFLEVIVRMFHLYNDMPTRFVDSNNINKWIPNQKGYAVYGNRKQNVAQYRINASGFNSYREFEPSEEDIELALIGDSFIEGFHQNYYNSIGKKIEEKISDIKVYEYGHSSNDFADQLYLTHIYPEEFSKIDYMVFYLRYHEDLDRTEYKHITRKPLFQKFRRSRLLEYFINIGLTDPLKEAVTYAKSIVSSESSLNSNLSLSDEVSQEKLIHQRQSNFNQLLFKYGFDKQKSAVLLDSRVTPASFISHLNELNIEVIDFSKSFEDAGGDKITTLIYDQHWNDFGRELIAQRISNYLKKGNFKTQIKK